MIRFALSGTKWTRKTTTITKLRARELVQDSSVVTLSRDIISKCPFPVHDKQTFDTSDWAIKRLDEILSYPVQTAFQVFDRSPLDVMAFTRHAAIQCGASPTALYDRIAKLSALFDVIFFCRPGGEWPAPITPDDSERVFALYIQHLMEESIASMRTQVVMLPWDANQRLESISEIISLKQERI